MMTAIVVNSMKREIFTGYDHHYEYNYYTAKNNNNDITIRWPFCYLGFDSLSFREISSRCCT